MRKRVDLGLADRRGRRGGQQQKVGLGVGIPGHRVQPQWVKSKPVPPGCRENSPRLGGCSMHAAKHAHRMVIICLLQYFASWQHMARYPSKKTWFLVMSILNKILPKHQPNFLCPSHFGK